MAQRKKRGKRQIESYAHAEAERLNTPHAGLAEKARASASAGAGKKTYAYDPHFDPKLDWAGKAERLSVEVPVRPLHVHERIDPRAIIKAVRKNNGGTTEAQMHLFEQETENPPEEKAIESYQHAQGWSNRLIAGDSLLVMTSLLEKEGMGGKVQCVYIDPPYGIKYGSNFQPFTNKRDVKDGKDKDLTQEPETIRAFRDTWELGIHSYLSSMRDRLLLAKELLTESGSCFVQISDENVHLVRCLMDEVFGRKNFISLIYFATTSGFSSSALSRIGDYLLWYSKDKGNLKYRPLFLRKEGEHTGDEAYKYLELEDGSRRSMEREERDGKKQISHGARIYRLGDLQSQGAASQDTPFKFRGTTFRPIVGSHWKATYPNGMWHLKMANRIEISGKNISFLRFFTDYPVKPMTSAWLDTGFAGFATDKKYVVETNTKVVQRCILMTTDPGDLVFDPTCGSGTTAYVAEQWGRRWITCDTSRVALALARQRLMTASFDYYKLQWPDQGVASGFDYETVPHVTLKSIANNPDINRIHERWQEGLEASHASLNKTLNKSWEEWEIPREAGADWPQDAKKHLAGYWEQWRRRKKEMDDSIAKYAGQETLYDRPLKERDKARVSGPFTVEAVPSPVVRSLDAPPEEKPADNSLARSGETARQAEWRNEIATTGIRISGRDNLRFSSVSPLPAPALHAEAETKEDPPRRAVISFGPEHAPLSQEQVTQAIEDAKAIAPKPALLVFAAFMFDPEAGRRIDEANGKNGMTLLKACMNADLMTDDLQKARRSNESFWLTGAPDLKVEKQGADYRVSVAGFDYYNPASGETESGGADQIAVWMLDTDYDGRSLYPRQVFFPLAGVKDGWARLAKSLKAEIDDSLIEAYRGTQSLPFSAGEHKRIAVKIVDNCGLESLAVKDLSDET